MEGHVSHNLASLYSSRPRGYRKYTLHKLIKLREMKLNGIKVYDNLLKSKSINTNMTQLDYSMFDKEYKTTYSYADVIMKSSI